MAYAFYDSLIGMVSPTDVDFAGPGPGPNVGGVTFGRMNFYLEELKAYDATLGAATLKYARYSGTIAAATVCEVTATIVGTALIESATPWQGVANSGRVLCVSLTAGVVGQFGWFVVQGHALVTTNGTAVVGSPLYWQANGVVSSTAVAGKQMLSAAVSVPLSTTLGSGASAVTTTATQAVIAVNRPFAQGQIL